MFSDGFSRIVPPPLDECVEQITRQTYDRIAAEYCASTPAPRVRRRIVRAALMFERLLVRNGHILVLGAGDGRDAAIFLAKGHRTTSLDYSAAMLHLGKERLRRWSRSASVLANIKSSPFRSGVFQGIWASACLYHVRKSALTAIMPRLHDLLAPGGVLYLNLRRGEGERLDPSPRSFPAGGPRFYAFYSQSEVLSLVTSFDILDIRFVDPIFGEDFVQAWLRKPAPAL